MLSDPSDRDAQNHALADWLHRAPSAELCGSGISAVIKRLRALNICIQNLSDYTDKELRDRWMDSAVTEQLAISAPGIHRK
eukprot:4992160-Heterocapsa_arctica.AAC.1